MPLMTIPIESISWIWLIDVSSIFTFFLVTSSLRIPKLLLLFNTLSLMKAFAMMCPSSTILWHAILLGRCENVSHKFTTVSTTAAILPVATVKPASSITQKRIFSQYCPSSFFASTSLSITSSYKTFLSSDFPLLSRCWWYIAFFISDNLSFLKVLIVFIYMKLTSTSHWSHCICCFLKFHPPFVSLIPPNIYSFPSSDLFFLQNFFLPSVSHSLYYIDFSWP